MRSIFELEVGVNLMKEYRLLSGFNPSKFAVLAAPVKDSFAISTSMS